MNPSERDVRDLADALDPSPDRIRAMGQSALDLVAGYLASLPTASIYPDTTSAALRPQFAGSVPEEGRRFEELVEWVADSVIPSMRHNGHPRFFGYVASPGTAATALADLLASALNPNVTSWRSAPGPTELEKQTVSWVAEILGCSPGTEGLFVSGGSMANFCGFAAARDAAAPQVSNVGMTGLSRDMVAYVSDEAHFSIRKAAGLLGIGRDNVRAVPVDRRLRMDAEALEQMIAADRVGGRVPFCVVASAGTVNTGAFDPIEAIADVAERHEIWLHVDGSYGGFAALAPSVRHLFRGIERADSIALDPHKWLYVPMDCGCILYRDPGRARAVFGHDAEYTRVLSGGVDESYAFWDYGPELSRRFRALKVWMMLAHVGTRALGEAIVRNCECARHLAQLVEESDDFEMLAPVELSIFCCRYVPPGMRAAYQAAPPAEREKLDRELDDLNERLLTLMQRAGSSYVSNTRVNGRFALRGCVLNFRTTLEDMEILLADARAAATAVLAH